MRSESRCKRGRIPGAVTAVLVLTLAASATVAEAPSAGDGPAGLVPASAIMFMQTSRLSSAAPAARYFIENLLPAQNAKKIEAWRADFKTKTGMDVLDAASLARADIDTGRPAAMAYLDAPKESERIMILVPVKNDRTFPQRFVEVLKKANRDRPGLDLHPAVSRRGNHAVYRMLNDVFFTGTRGYLVVASSQDIITSVLDAGASALASDPLFAEYLAKKRPGNDLDLYITKTFIRQISEERRGKTRPRDDEDSGDAPDGDSDQAEKQNGKTERAAPGKDTLSMMGARSDFFEYMAAGFARTKDGISLDFAIALAGASPSTALVCELFRPGLPEYTLSAAEPLAYHYLSFDAQALNAFCEKNARSAEFAQMCAQYAKFKKDTGASLGVDLDADFLPWFGGYFNVVMRKAKIAGTLDNFVLFVPMADKAKSAVLMKKLRGAAKEKNTDQGAFGEERIDTVPSFWFKDKRGNRISVLAAQRGLFVANNTEFLREVLASDSGTSKPAAGLFGNPDPGVFMLSYLRVEKESYMKALLMFLTYNAGPHIAGLVNRIETISLTGTRAGAYFSFSMAFRLLESDGRAENR